MIQLDIVSDPICPWCYIGKAELEFALHQRPDHPFQIQWHPFQLNPDMPPQGMDRMMYFEMKFGSKESAAERYIPIIERCESLNLNVDFASIERTPNTLDAHRLIHWAGLEQKQNLIVDALFSAYFQQGKDIGDAGVLADLAESVGMDRAVTERLIVTDNDRSDIAARDAEARHRGIQGVPCFIIAGQHVLSGAQPAAVWLDVIDQLNAQLAAKPALG